MKKYITIIVTFILVSSGINAQNVNWNAIQENQKHTVYLDFGYEYSMTAKLGYAYKLNDSLKVFNNSMPVLLNLDYSFPMGGDLFDDFKVRLGGQINFFERNNFVASGKVLGIIRRIETDMVRITNFGGEFGLTAGYYKPKWHTAIEFGYDKAITSHFKHSALMKNSYAEIQDGWYMPNGGNFYYGIVAGKSLGEKMDISLKLGLTNAEGKDENALLPYYAQLGINKRY